MWCVYFLIWYHAIYIMLSAWQRKYKIRSRYSVLHDIINDHQNIFKKSDHQKTASLTLINDDYTNYYFAVTPLASPDTPLLHSRWPRRPRPPISLPTLCLTLRQSSWPMIVDSCSEFSPDRMPYSMAILDSRRALSRWMPSMHTSALTSHSPRWIKWRCLISQLVPWKTGD